MINNKMNSAILNISRTVFTLPFLGFLIFTVKKKDCEEVYSDKDKKKIYERSKYFKYLYNYFDYYFYYLHNCKSIFNYC